MQSESNLQDPGRHLFGTCPPCGLEKAHHPWLDLLQYIPLKGTAGDGMGCCPAENMGIYSNPYYLATGVLRAVVLSAPRFSGSSFCWYQTPTKLLFFQEEWWLDLPYSIKQGYVVLFNILTSSEEEDDDHFNPILDFRVLNQFSGPIQGVFLPQFCVPGFGSGSNRALARMYRWRNFKKLTPRDPRTGYVASQLLTLLTLCRIQQLYHNVLLLPRGWLARPCYSLLLSLPPGGFLPGRSTLLNEWWDLAPWAHSSVTVGLVPWLRSATVLQDPNVRPHPCVCTS